MSYPHKYAYSSSSLQADYLYEIQDSNLFIRHILYHHVPCTLFPFVPIVLREFQSKDYPSFYTTSSLTSVFKLFAWVYIIWVMCSFPLGPTVLDHKYVQNSYISLFCALIINHISFMEIHRSFFLSIKSGDCARIWVRMQTLC